MKKAVLIGTMVVLAGCAGSKAEGPEKVSLTFQAQLDSGNAAYRRGDYKTSAKFFYQATESDKENLSGWYGVYMVESKLGNTEAANKAREIVAKAAPEMPLTEHPSAKDHPEGALGAPTNPHVPQAGAPAKLPIDSLREAKKEKP